MIDDVVVIDAVAHALDLRPENWNNPPVCEPFREFGYYGIHQLAVPVEEPEWASAVRASTRSSRTPTWSRV